MKIKKIIIGIALGITVMCVGVLVALVISNAGLPTELENPGTLSIEEIAVIEETEKLVSLHGNEVWPGFGDITIPTILYNNEYVFLTGLEDPSDGWAKIPAFTQYGSTWEMQTDTFVLGHPVYRQAIMNGQTPEAFTVLVGDHWVTSMPTYNWMRLELSTTIQEEMPPFLMPIFPTKLFLDQLLQSQDHYISLLAHERFHGFQGIVAEEKLLAGEAAVINFSRAYPFGDEAFEAAWLEELELLEEILRTKDRDTLTTLTEQFLTLRAERRQAAGLSSKLIAFEQQREWVEGLARYTELLIWQAAYEAGYTCSGAATQLSDFDCYGNFEKRLKSELMQFPLMADTEGDSRFYYSGMAQAYILDALLPGWKNLIFDEGVWLEDLLQMAIK